MKGIERTLSREESQNNENDDLEMGSKQTRIPVRLHEQGQRDVETGLLNTDLKKKSKKLEIRKEEMKSWNYAKKVGMFLGKTVLVLAVGFLMFMEVRRNLTSVELKETTNENRSPPPLPQVSAFQQQKPGTEKITNPYPEEYKVDIDQLHDYKNLSWVPEIGNSQVLSKPSSSTGCIELVSSGKFKVFNSITLSYDNVLSVYHAVSKKKAKVVGLSQGEAFSVVKKANFQWKTPQTGRQPSTLQFLVDAEVGDQLCVQTNNFGMIYASYSDNIFLIEKL